MKKFSQLLFIFFSLTTIIFAADRIVNVYYYPWYDVTRHWGEGYLRDHLVPQQMPMLGEYSNRDSEIIEQHLDWSDSYGIDNWVCSWWGPDSWEDVTILDHIVPQMENHQTTYCLLYEAAGLLNLSNDAIEFDNDRAAALRNHFDYMAQNHFNNPHYQKIDGRPVVYIYLTRTFTGDYKNALQQVRDDMNTLGYNVYLVGDEVYWGDANYERIATLDAITAYNMHGPHEYAGYPQDTGFIEDVAEKYEYYRNAAQILGGGAKFIPKIMPGFNDRGVRLDADHYIIPNQVHPDSSQTSTFEHFADAVEHLIDPDLNMVCITSFNEWHEDTQIEPTINTATTQTDDSENNDYTQNFSYTGYGLDYLEIIRDKYTDNNTSVMDSEQIPSSFKLLQNYPNPFNPSTQISYKLLTSGHVKLLVYDIQGREIQQLVDEFQNPGIYHYSFNAKTLASGIYFYRLFGSNQSITKKMVLLQ